MLKSATTFLRKCAQRCLFAVFALVQTLPAQTDELAIGVKAAFLYNFTKFIQWPNRVPGSDVLNICVTAPLPEYNVIKRVIQGRSVQSSSVEVVYVTERADIAHCHLLYFSSTDVYGAERWISEIQDLPIVTVGEGARFINDKGIIALFNVDGKIAFSINEARARNTDLIISSKLLSLAKEVVR